MDAFQLHTFTEHFNMPRLSLYIMHVLDSLTVGECVAEADMGRGVTQSDEVREARLRLSPGKRLAAAALIVIWLSAATYNIVQTR